MNFEDYLKKKLNEENELSPPVTPSPTPPPNSNLPEPTSDSSTSDAGSQNVTAPLFSASTPNVKPKWKASKTQIMNYWRGLREDQPIPMRPIRYTHKGSTYGEDGIRITGSPVFIQAVLGKLRELLRYESSQTKLAVVYRQTVSKKRQAIGLSPTSFVFYIQAKERGKKRKK